MPKKQKKTIEEMEHIEAQEHFIDCPECQKIFRKEIRQILQRFIEETVGKMYRNLVLYDEYPEIAEDNKRKFEIKQEIEKKMKQWLKETL